MGYKACGQLLKAHHESLASVGRGTCSFIVSAFPTFCRWTPSNGFFWISLALPTLGVWPPFPNLLSGKLNMRMRNGHLRLPGSHGLQQANYYNSMKGIHGINIKCITSNSSSRWSWLRLVASCLMQAWQAACSYAGLESGKHQDGRKCPCSTFWARGSQQMRRFPTIISTCANPICFWCSRHQGRL